MRVKVQASGEHGAHARLAHGQFFGQFQTEVEAGGFSLAYVRADPDHDVQRHTHEAAHFIFVTRGVYLTSARDAAGDGTSPLLVYNPPGTTHRDRFARRRDGGFDGRFLSISIAPERMRSIEDGVRLAERSTAIASAETSTLAVRLIAELGRWGPVSLLAAEGICLELVASMARLEIASEKTPPRWLLAARDMLREGAAPRTVSEIAAACGVHPVHLARAFRGFYGCSPRAYLQRCRLERAAALLRKPGASLTDVAVRSGFADQSHMTHAFRRAYAMTPAAYRRQIDVDNDVASTQDESAV